MGCGEPSFLHAVMVMLYHCFTLLASHEQNRLLPEVRHVDTTDVHYKPEVMLSVIVHAAVVSPPIKNSRYSDTDSRADT